jgi:signal transduction histidine kinase
LKTYSLTRRLIAAVLLVELCSTLVLVVSAGVYEGLSRFHTFDVMLRGRADSMLGAVQDAEDPQDNVMLDGTQSSAPERDIYAVRDELGRMLGHSRNWPDAANAFELPPAEFRSFTIGRQRYRVIRIVGLRMVDPGDKGGGIARHVVILYGARTHPIWESVLHAIAFYSLLGLLLLGISGWIMLRLLRDGLQPLRELAGQAAQVSVEAWRFEPSEKVKRVRELAPLASALEAVLAGLERSFEQQKHFVSDAAHELKTSVAVVKSSLQVLMMRNRDPEEYRTGLKRAEVDCERMEELVASMLTLAGLEAGAVDEQHAVRVELGDIVSEVSEHLRTASELSDVRFILRGDQPVWVAGEREKLRLLCSNLLHNALQHSNPGSEVRALLRVENGMAELRIEDDGEGIAPEALPHVFERFYRADVSRSRRTGGTGLGLAISKAIVQSMKGEIRIESQTGQGTQVQVTLPAVPWQAGLSKSKA